MLTSSIIYPISVKYSTNLERLYTIIVDIYTNIVYNYICREEVNTLDKSRQERRKEEKAETVKTVTAIIGLINSILTLIYLLIR